MPPSDPYVMEPHTFTRQICSWRYCAKCGLIALSNPFTQWCIKKGCNYEDHPGYKAERAKTGKRWK